MAELTQFGFERDNRTDITNRLNGRFRDKFGANLLLTDDSVAGLFRSILSERSLEFEKLLEDVYYSRTLNGAEGIALDDAASYYGFTRRGPQPSSGVAHIELVSDSTNLGFNIETTASFSGDNGLSYQPVVGGTINQNITGFIIDCNVLTAQTYNFSITDVVNGGVADFSITLDSQNSVDVETFASQLVLDIQSRTVGNISSVFQTGGVVYAGYGSVDEFIGLAQPIYFESLELPVGITWWAGYDVEATIDGYNTLAVGGITGFSPTFSGYQSATNTVEFDPGSENETDAEFRLRIQTSNLRNPVGTRDGLVQAIEEVDNVISVAIYDNPTLTQQVYADPLTFNCVVRGGLSQEIAQAIYDNKPIGRNTYGTTSVNITTADSKVETVKFTQAAESSYDLRITYVVNNTTPLSAREQSLIEDRINEIIDGISVGTTIPNSQLVAAVLSSLPAGRLLSVQVERKVSTQGTESFAVGDLDVDFDQYAVIGGFTFVRTV